MGVCTSSWCRARNELLSCRSHSLEDTSLFMVKRAWCWGSEAAPKGCQCMKAYDEEGNS